MSAAVAAIRASDEDLAALSKELVAFAARRVGDTAADDIAQASLQTLTSRYPQLEGENLRRVGFRIASFKTLALQAQRRSRGEDSAVSPEDIDLRAPEPDPEHAYAARELRRRLVKAILSLGERCRTLFAHLARGCSATEITKLMDAPNVDAVHMWSFRCRQQLRKRLGDNWRSFS